MEDFTYDVSKMFQWETVGKEEYYRKFMRSYLFTHQFSEDVVLSNYDILHILEYFLEDEEFVFGNENQLFFIVNKTHPKDEIIGFLTWVLNTMSIRIEHIQQLCTCDNKLNLLLTIKQYENTFNGK